MAPTWSLACIQTDCNTEGMSKLRVLTPSRHKQFYHFIQCWANVEHVGPTLYKLLYKCVVFAGQEDFLSNIVHFANVGLMLGQRRRRSPNIKTALGECLVGVVSRVL